MGHASQATAHPRVISPLICNDPDCLMATFGELIAVSAVQEFEKCIRDTAANDAQMSKFSAHLCMGHPARSFSAMI